MKKIYIVLSIFFLFFTYSSSKAAELSPTGAYWSLEVEYGSGQNTLNHAENSYDENHLSIPHTYSLPKLDEIWISDTPNPDPNANFYSYAYYAGRSDIIEAYAEGFARDNSSETEWFYSYSFVAVASDTFTGLSLFLGSFDWEFDVYLGSGNLDAQVGIALVDYTDPNNWFILKQEEINYNPNLPTSGTCNVSWSLDPSRTYLYGVWAQVELTGYEASDDFYAVATVENIHAEVVPEPTTSLLLLLGLGTLVLIAKIFMPSRAH